MIIGDHLINRYSIYFIPTDLDLFYLRVFSNSLSEGLREK